MAIACRRVILIGIVVPPRQRVRIDNERDAPSIAQQGPKPLTAITNA
jgi:hypothetical protein